MDVSPLAEVNATHFHIGDGWKLYDLQEWQLPGTLPTKTSDAAQRSHFHAFFRTEHALRHGLPPGVSLAETVMCVRHGLSKLELGGVWLRLHSALRARHCLKRFVLAKHATHAPNQVLEGWLAYWQEAEGKAQDELHPRQWPPKLLAERSGTGPRGHQRAFTPDSIKAQVLWGLYWLLQGQFAEQKRAHGERWAELVRQRRQLLDRSSPFQEFASPEISIWDFRHQQPVSLRAVDAALFVMALRPPRFRCRPGEEVTLKEFVRLANAAHRGGGPAESSPPPGHVSTVITAFLDSPLYDGSGWLHQRLLQTAPIVPPQRWRAEAKAPVDKTPWPAETERTCGSAGVCRLSPMPARKGDPVPSPTKPSPPPSHALSPLRPTSSVLERSATFHVDHTATMVLPSSKLNRSAAVPKLEALPASASASLLPSCPPLERLSPQIGSQPPKASAPAKAAHETPSSLQRTGAGSPPERALSRTQSMRAPQRAPELLDKDQTLVRMVSLPRLRPTAL